VIIWSASGRDWYGFRSAGGPALSGTSGGHDHHGFLTMAWWAQPPYDHGPGQWLANLTMLAPMFGQPFMDGAYWSIVIEIIFYGWVMIGLFTGVLPRHTDPRWRSGCC
jgi:hypothetical protein